MRISESVLILYFAGAAAHIWIMPTLFFSKILSFLTLFLWLGLTVAIPHFNPLPPK